MTQIPIMGDGLPQPLLEMLGAEFEVLAWDDAPDSPALARAEAIIAYGHPQVDGPMLDRAPQLKVISNHGVGVDHIDVAAALQRGIPVGNTPGCLDAATADMTMALMLATARNVVVGDQYAHSPEFLHYDPAILIGQEVTGSKLGIVGMGRIGKQVAKRAAGFDMQIIYHNRHRDSSAESDYKAEYRSLDDLLAESDFVALNCPLTPETTGLISGPQFAMMKSSAILINMARGPVVDPAALYTALSTGQIAAAGIDVTDPEPLPRGHELLALENLIITPHLGSASNRTRERMLRMTVENLHAGLQGKPLPYSVEQN
ncbi:Glyoxylate/hydroxypyruvate reductase B [Symmachiella macrocystis]|uniref:Glyoxylate/hydroxypyruvate reductase B n=1 Tax=Symmachiella macrocystis TaxID=2527985 RepID=A0A5C6BB86_9PLAN|nr:D-glycerate dehydrogenase [Symmachiella macrocystis]TWU09250.1 Glyoxylate/hydroxypyruvate reductase B [Symmachiella macrocystis]